jgi:C-terminal processing protease CtpA/Prc
VRKLTLGPVEVGDLVARLSTQKSGALTREDTAALVGPDVLKQFTLVVDYSRKRLIFEKNGNFGKPDVYDRTGMWMGQNDSGFEVLDVTAGGPAAAAGLAVGDTILSVDGARADRLVLPAVRLRFRTDAPGTRVRMRVLSTGKERDVTLTLRDLV